MNICGCRLPDFVILVYNEQNCVLNFTEEQITGYEKFCNDLMRRMSVTVYEATKKALQYVVYGLLGQELNESWGEAYHDLIVLFPQSEIERLVPATQEQIDEFVPFVKMRKK